MDTESHIPTAEAIVMRSERIGVPISRLAVAAGLKASTASRWKSKTNSANATSLKKMATQLEARERDLLAYLLRLYPDARAAQ